MLEISAQWPFYFVVGEGGGINHGFVKMSALLQDQRKWLLTALEFRR